MALKQKQAQIQSKEKTTVAEKMQSEKIMEKNSDAVFQWVYISTIICHTTPVCMCVGAFTEIHEHQLWWLLVALFYRSYLDPSNLILRRSLVDTCWAHLSRRFCWFKNIHKSLWTFFVHWQNLLYKILSKLMMEFKSQTCLSNCCAPETPAFSLKCQENFICTPHVPRHFETKNPHQY